MYCYRSKEIYYLYGFLLMTCSLTKSSVQIYSSDDKHLVVSSSTELGES